MSDELGKSLQHSVNQKFGRGTYQVLQPIKRGADGYVYKIQFIKQKRLGALKVLPKLLLTIQPQNIGQLKNKYSHDTNLQRKAQNEIKIHSSLNSSYVVRLQNWSKDDMNYYLVLQYIAKGDLGDEIYKYKQNGLSFNRIRKIGLQLAKGIDTIHKKSIIHRDIKPQNILLTQQDQIKICDFSCASQLKYNKYSKQKQKLNGAIGTLQYMAPQILGKYDNSVDVWSYGCVLYTMIFGKTPFKLVKHQLSQYLKKVSKNKIQQLRKGLYQNIKVKKFHKQECQCRNLNISHDQCCKKLTHLIKNILEIDVNKRFTLTQIIKHPFFTGQPLQYQQQQEENAQQKKQQLNKISQRKQKLQQYITFNRNNKQQSPSINQIKQNHTDRPTAMGTIKINSLFPSQQKQKVNILNKKQQQQQKQKLRPKTSYSLQNIKKHKQNNKDIYTINNTQPYYNHNNIYANTKQYEKRNKKTQSILQKYKQIINIQPSHKTSQANSNVNTRNNSNNSKVIEKQNRNTQNLLNLDANKANKKVERNDKANSGKIKNLVSNNMQQLMKYKLKDKNNNNNTINTTNKYISDGNHNNNNNNNNNNNEYLNLNTIPNQSYNKSHQNSTSIILQPLNCQNIEHQVQINGRQQIVIDKNGLKGQFTDSGKAMIISPKGCHIKICYGEKSKQYTLQKLPQKYCKLYIFYKDILQKIKKQSNKNNNNNNNNNKISNSKDKNITYNSRYYDNNNDGRVCRTSRQKQMKNKDIHKLNKQQNKYHHQSKQSRQSRQQHINKQQVKYKQRANSNYHTYNKNIVSNLHILTYTNIQLQLYTPSISKNSIKNMNFTQQNKTTQYLFQLSKSSQYIYLSIQNSTNNHNANQQHKLIISQYTIQHIYQTIIQLLISYNNVYSNKQEQYKQYIYKCNKQIIYQYCNIIREYCKWFNMMPKFDKIQQTQKIQRVDRVQQSRKVHKQYKKYNNYNNYSNKQKQQCMQNNMNINNKNIYNAYENGSNKNKQKYYDHKMLLNNNQYHKLRS